MLTPRFTVRQDDGFVIVEMRIPGHVKLGEDDVWMEGRSFKFHAHPYFLSLELPGEVVQDGREHAEFDRVNDKLTVWIPKMNFKEHFDGLDMLTHLMTPIGSIAGPAGTAAASTTTGIEVMDGSKKRRNEEDFNEIVAAASESTSNDNNIAQVEGSDELMLGISRPTYGFNSGFSGFFEPLQEDLHDIVDIPDPDHILAQDRRFLREQDEDQKFNPDHYMADLMEFDGKEMLEFRPWWAALREEFESSLKTIQEGSASNNEKEEKESDGNEEEEDDDDDDDMGSWNPASIAMLSTPKIKSDMEQLRIKIIPLNEDDQEILLKLPRRECKKRHNFKQIKHIHYLFILFFQSCLLTKTVRFVHLWISFSPTHMMSEQPSAKGNQQTKRHLTHTIIYK